MLHKTGRRVTNLQSLTKSAANNLISLIILYHISLGQASLSTEPCNNLFVLVSLLSYANMATISQATQKLLDTPAMPAPPGLKHNFINPPNLKTEFYVDLNLCLIIAILAVCMRIWTKVRLIRKVEIEDCKDFSFPLGNSRRLKANKYKTSVL